MKLVANMGQELPVEIEANWSQWVRRWDGQGCRQHGRAWGSVVRDELVPVVERINNGDAKAFIRWHTFWTRRWSLDGHDVVVPAAPAAASASDA